MADMPPQLFRSLNVHLIKLGTAADAVAKGIATHAEKETARRSSKLRDLEIARSLGAKALPFGEHV